MQIDKISYYKLTFHFPAFIVINSISSSTNEYRQSTVSMINVVAKIKIDWNKIDI